MHVLKEKLVGFLRNYSSGFFLISVFLSPGFAQNPQDFYHRDSGFFLISVFLSPGFRIFLNFGIFIPGICAKFPWFLSPGIPDFFGIFYLRDRNFLLETGYPDKKPTLGEMRVGFSPEIPIPGIKDPRKTEIVGGIAFDLHVVKNLKKIKFNR